MEQAVGAMDPRVARRIEAVGAGAAEVCGLWLAPGAGGHGISRALVMGIAAVAYRRRLGVVFGLSAAHTRALFEGAGWRVDPDLGIDGSFPYPTARYATRVITLDVAGLDSAREPGATIARMARRPVGRMPFHGRRGDVDCRYDLEFTGAPVTSAPLEARTGGCGLA